MGLTESPDSFNREYVKSLQFRSGGKEFLKNLHKRGIAVSVVTNDLTDGQISFVKFMDFRVFIPGLSVLNMVFANQILQY
ncbi:MAG: hypothetical protein Ct9H90mP11_06530 [Acidimicrobiales bacterium]|nr:MAG: hypothetical protein Ct9H90mP11_06530 [Acidimicrobiales bacterium]